MKVVHLTDLHVQMFPGWGDLWWTKRWLGTTNLYVLGRRSKFSVAAQRAAVTATVAEAPDAVVVTGDLTAQGLPSEFAAARELLDPILSQFPTVMIPGNHDTYVREPEVGAAMRKVFGPWMGGPLPHLTWMGDVGFLLLETCRPHPLSSGWCPPAQLERAQALLADAPDGFILLVQHYPLRGRRGAPYGPATRALANARAVEALVASTDRIGAVLHGHEHHGFTTTIPGRSRPVPIHDPGASGYAFLPALGRTSHLGIYDVVDGALAAVRRLRFDGASFVEEPGGAYASGG